MNTERITLTMKEQKMNDILVKLIAGELLQIAGELLQIDASKHKWFYGDDNYYHLHGVIDDSTGIVTGCYLTKQETLFGYQMVLYQTIKDYGIPECLYSDYRTVFQSNKKELSIEDELQGKEIENTRFTNMLKHNGIDIISTTNPMAKDRIERLWRTFQDRLYKELKKKNISSLKKANDFITNEFLPRYNNRFALPIDDNKNLFVCPIENFNYNVELAVYKEYSIHKHCYLRMNNKTFVILDNDINAFIDTKQKVKVYTFLDGSINVLFKDKFYQTKEVKIISKQEFVQKLSKASKSKTDWSALNKKNSKNFPWRNGLPPMPSFNSTVYAYFHGC